MARGTLDHTSQRREQIWLGELAVVASKAAAMRGLAVVVAMEAAVGQLLQS
jgi:hypothetical protein